MLMKQGRIQDALYKESKVIQELFVKAVKEGNLVEV